MFYFLSLIYIGLLGFSVRTMNRNDIFSVLLFFILSFCFYILIYKYAAFRKNKEIFFLGVFLRFVTIFTLPVFSDDFFRFLWDGYLFSNGVSPYNWTPTEWMLSHSKSEAEITLLYEGMNSKNYFSVYPFILQFLIALPWFLGIKSLIFQVVSLQLTLLFVEICNLFLLKEKELKPTNLWLFAGNPILILETVSQIHFEGLILLLFLLLIRFHRLLKKGTSAILYFLILQIKINFIFIFPGLLDKKNSRSNYLMFISVMISLLVLYLTVFRNWKFQFETGIGLFFHSFRFHSLFEQIIYCCLGFFPSLVYLSGMISLVLAGVIYLFSLLKFELPFENRLLFGLLLFLLFSPVLHSWYFVPFIGLSLYLGYHISLALIFSGFAAASYFLYPLTESSWGSILAIIEIFILGVYIWKKKLSSFLQKIPYMEK